MMRVSEKRSMSPVATVGAKARATARRRLRSAGSTPSSSARRSTSNGSRDAGASCARRAICACVALKSSIPSSGASRVSCVRHFAGSEASMAATKVACTAIAEVSTCATNAVMAACCSWLRRLRNTSGGSDRPPMRRTPEGIVSASVMPAAAGAGVGVGVASSVTLAADDCQLRRHHGHEGKIAGCRQG